jgi:tetratricopeptide (TPR) repeat protein
MPTLIVPGKQIDAPKVKDARLADFGIAVETRHAVAVEPVSRGGVAEQATIPDAHETDVVELRYAGGGYEWLRVDSLAGRVGQAERGSVETGVIRVPPTLARSAEATRGLPDLVLEGLELLKIDPFGPLAKLAVEASVPFFEKRFMPNPGLYRLDERGQPAELISAELPRTDDPSLILIHGTFFDNAASFGKLFDTAEWRQLRDRYQARAFTLEHHTLSLSPAQNALDLARLLPRGSRLHLVTHSRGGLVGELLGLAALPDAALAPFRRSAQDRSRDIGLLTELTQLIQEKELRIERFVRVACPARGTVLASDRLDRFLSLVLNLIGAIPALDESVVYPFVKATALAIIKQRADPDVLPGLEAMIPDSPYIHLLNRPGLTSNADLAVVAGDVEGQGILQRLAVLATDLFFREDHDLVVDTDSMYDGPQRSRPVFYSFQRGPDIHHLAYFSNAMSRQRIAGWLLRDDGQTKVDGFEELAPIAPPELTFSVFRSRAAPAPVLFLIPGAMGTHLKAGAERVWLHSARLAAGDFARLALGQPATQEPVTLDGLLAAPYGPLIDHLQHSCEVITFPYDWRRSLWEAGSRLAVEIAAELRKHDRPVHILAHSAGGLVARAMIAQDQATWQAVCRRKGRLLLVGTPLRGAYWALQLLTGDARLVRLLSLLDPDRSPEKIAAVLRTFPGLVELLPDHPGLDAWDVAWWRDACFQELLREARRVQRLLRQPQAVDPAHTYLILGAAERTPAGISFSPQGKITYQGNSAGDGVVPHTSSRLEGAPAWTMNAAHGDLLATPASFPALVDILLQGYTGNLPISSAVQGSESLFELVATERSLFPRESDLAAAALGGLAPGRAVEEIFPLRIKVTHGSLENACHPVAVGHYRDDIIVGAESWLDRHLDGRLARRHVMGLYPEEPGEVAVALMAPAHHPPGGIVVGLGPVGEISPERLTRGVTKAALQLATAVVECPQRAAEGPGWRSAAFSSVLIGTQSGRGMSIEGCIAAIVKGAVLANRILQSRSLWDQVRIDEVEFIELYQDSATHAARVVKEIGTHLRLILGARERIEPAIHLQTAEGGLFEHPVAAYEGGWWRRLKIRRAAVGLTGVPEGSLEFVLLTDRARAEESLLATETQLVDQLVAEMIAKPYDRDVPATLYGMLMPNRLKEQAYETADLQLVLDSYAAQYPWEMLAERGRDEAPRPLATRMGVIRQLEVQHFRERVATPRGNKALVIGEPDLGDNARFPPLPGARAEAEAVRDLLKSGGYEVLSLIGPGATTNAILNAFFGKEYRIIHIAGHGAYDRADPRCTGVVIGDDQYLTAGTIQQLEIVPDLVFLNCCHLARTDAGDVPPPAYGQPQPPWNLLAASVSEALIRIGVRAIVAAGWAVNDRAARFFAQEFYSLLLSGAGQGFGKVVFEARRNLMGHPDFGVTSNAWGAYQCYGDPGFTLRRQVVSAAKARVQPVAAHEIVRELRDIERSARRPVGDDPDVRQGDLNRVRYLDGITPVDWRNGEMLYSLAAALGELGAFEQAIEYYQQAIASPNFQEQVPLAAVEQLANLQVRYAEQLRQNLEARRQAGQLDASQVAEIEQKRMNLQDDAFRRLERLLAVAETPERMALMASWYKRKFTATSGNEREALLKNGQRWYGKAHAASQEKKLNPYHALNWVAFRVFDPRSDRPAAQQELRDLITRSERMVQQRAPAQRDFWAWVTIPDAAVLRALLDENLEQRFDAIVELYREAFSHGVSERQRNSVLQHLDFLIATATWRSERESPEAWITCVGSLVRLRKAISP